MSVQGEKNLLFGLLALQNGLIDQAQLVAGFRAWTRDRTQPLVEHLPGLDSEAREAISALVALHLKKHGDNAEKSLASIPAGASTREALATIDDAMLQATLRHLGTAATEVVGDRTATYAVASVATEGGRFRVLRPHARGGLGAVFVALDEELHREVALKQILDKFADDPVSRQRFVAEAEITGGLEHPGIVPVYGLGTYADGRPYYAMRFIRGDSLKEAIERFHRAASPSAGAEQGANAGGASRDLELRRLLRRFLDVCNAIDYAHSRGVLHRDIKPGNIIIGKYGETLVVDWGLAKATGRRDPSTAERTLVPSSSGGSGTETLPGSAIGTPAYMSPEQARGDLDSLDARSDVYSLGATLYALLTGKPAFADEDVGAMLKKVESGTFPPPRQVNLAIDKALEAICLKAMALRPEARYASCKALVDDIEHWLADEPVSAWREPLTRRLRRWTRRHRTTVATAAALLLTAVVALSVSMILIQRERDRAEASFRRAREAVDEYFTTVSESKLLDVPGMQPLRKQLLESARRYYEDFLHERRDDRAVRAEAAASLFRVAQVTILVDKPDVGLPLYRRAIDEFESIVKAEPANDRAKSNLAYCHSTLGLAFDGMERDEEAMAELQQALQLREALARAHPNNAWYQADVARSHRTLGDLYRQVGDFAPAEEHWRTALSMQEAILANPPRGNRQRHPLTGRHDLVTSVREDLVDTLLDLSGMLREQGRWDEALRLGQRGLGMLRDLRRERPDDSELIGQLVGGSTSLSLTTLNSGDPQAAHDLARMAIELGERIVAENPSVTYYRGRLADAYLTDGFAAERLGWFSEALTDYRQAARLSEELVSAEPGSTFAKSLAAQGWLYQSRLLIRERRLDEALPLLRRAQQFQEELVRNYPKVLFYRFNLAFICRALGRAEEQSGRAAEAFAAFDRALQIDSNDAGRIFIARYNEACDLALMAGVCGDDRKSELKRRAVSSLQSAIAQGYRSYAELSADADLSAVRDLPALGELVLDLAMPQNVFAKD